MEILIVGIIMIFLFNYLNLFNFNKFVSDNKSVFNKLKEDDYEFLLVAKYGDKVDPILRYQKRVKTAIVTMLIGTIAAMTIANDINFAPLFLKAGLYRIEIGSLTNTLGTFLFKVKSGLNPDADMQQNGYVTLDSNLNETKIIELNKSLDQIYIDNNSQFYTARGFNDNKITN